MEACHNHVRHSASDPGEIIPGMRAIEIPALTVRWGEADLREDWTGGYLFCSFRCLSEWAADRAQDHDQHVLTEGTLAEA